jgi:hypothetical protein
MQWHNLHSHFFRFSNLHKPHIEIPISSDKSMSKNRANKKKKGDIPYFLQRLKEPTVV